MIPKAILSERAEIQNWEEIDLYGSRNIPCWNLSVRMAAVHHLTEEARLKLLTSALARQLEESERACMAYARRFGPMP